MIEPMVLPPFSAGALAPFGGADGVPAAASEVGVAIAGGDCVPPPPVATSSAIEITADGTGSLCVSEASKIWVSDFVSPLFARYFAVILIWPGFTSKNWTSPLEEG